MAAVVVWRPAEVAGERRRRQPDPSGRYLPLNLVFYDCARFQSGHEYLPRQEVMDEFLSKQVAA
jgi:hypothetical protein